MRLSIYGSGVGLAFRVRSLASDSGFRVQGLVWHLAFWFWISSEGFDSGLACGFGSCLAFRVLVQVFGFGLAFRGLVLV